MANRAVTLYLRIKTPEGKKPYCKPVFLAKGRLKPLYAFVNGEPEHRPEGVYYMRFGADSGKQQMVPLGNDPYVALDKLAAQETDNVGFGGSAFLTLRGQWSSAWFSGKTRIAWV